MKKRSQSDQASSSKRKKANPINLDDFKHIKRDAYEGEYEGKPAVAKTGVREDYIPLYNKWKDTRALPEVYVTFKHEDGNVKFGDDYAHVVVMEKLVPFVYDETKRQSYFDAIAEVYALTGYKEMDISPGNTMMRADGQIVFIDLWTTSWTPLYHCKREPPRELLAIKKSLARVLFDYKHKAAIIAMQNSSLAELKAFLPTQRLLGMHTSCDTRIYVEIEDKRKCTYTLGLILTALKRARLVKSWMDEHGKKIEDYKLVSSFASNWPEYDKCYDNNIRYSSTSDEEMIKMLGGTAEEIEDFQDLPYVYQSQQ